MDLLLLISGFLILLGFILSPFPYWPTYFRLWVVIVKVPGTWKEKSRQGWFLLKTAMKAPLWGLLWLIDELFFSAYKKQEIRPVFIIGQPRCGTTLLHRTLARDDETFFAVRHIEWRYPFIVVQKLFAALGIDKQVEKANYWPDSEAGRLAAKMHSNNLSDWEEEGIFFEENFLHHFFIFLRFPYPELLSYLDSFPELSVKSRMKMLDAHQRVLQKVQYLRGPVKRIYLSKEVTSHNKIPFLIERYPDARFILTVRAADEFMASLLALIRTSTQSKTGVDPAEMPGWQDAVIERMQADCELLVSLCRNVISAESLVPVSANDYMSQIDIATEDIYRSLNLTFRADFCEDLISLRASQKKRDRGYSYDPVTLIGFDEYDQFVAEVRGQFQQRMRSLQRKPTIE